MALPAGESPSLRYLIKSEPPVKSAPSLSGSITGIITPMGNLITGRKLRPGDRILVDPSTGLGANGISLVIKRAMTLPDQFLTKLPTGRTLGEECLIPMRSHVTLVERLLKNQVIINAILPATGDGVGKVAFDKRDYSYRIHSWVPVPPLFQFMGEIGVSLIDRLKTFNHGAGLYLYVPPSQVNDVIRTGKEIGHPITEVGVVEDGPRQTIFEPEGIILPPPGE